jgi:hypothetical protein
VAIWYIFLHFGIFCQEKSGNPARKRFYICSEQAKEFIGTQGLSITGLPDGYVFEPKIPILVKFGGPWNRKCCYIL